MQPTSKIIHGFTFASVFVFAICLLHPLTVTAQWTTNSNDVSNTNTGNVGIGTGATAPTYKLNVAGSEDKSQIRFGLGALDSGGFLFSNGPTNAVFSGGASWNGGWFAKAINASSIQLNTGTITFFANSGLTQNSLFTPTARMSINANGYVGIGGTPTSKLHVISGTDSGTTLLSLDTGVHGGTSMAVFGTANNESGFDMSVYRAGTYTSRFGVSSAGNVYFQPASGNVGIGTSTPGYSLEVVGGSPWIARFKKTGNSNGGIIVDSVTGYNPNVALAVNGANKWHLLNNATASDALQFWEATGSFARFTLTQAGTVGIGTATPNAGYKLDVAGHIRSSSGGFVFPDGTIQTTAGGGGSSITAVNAGSGLTGGGTSGSLTLNLGAGTGVTVAADTVSVNYGSAAGTAVQGNTSITVSAGTGMSGGGSLTLGAGGSVTLTNADRGSSQSIFKNVANSAGTTQFTAGSNADSIRFQGNGGTTVSFDAATKKVIIDGSTSTVTAANISAGQFGAGNYTFPSNVTVVGTLEGGTIKAKYQDIAEWVESSQELEAGTVVVLDTNKSNQVVAAMQAYDSRVAGVISLQPGIALGEQSEERVLVATTGRVKVKVDASNGPINIGDLLVTSDKTGVAMKSVPVEIGGVRIHRPGTLLGKALEPLAQGQGEILVLLSLQ